MDRLAPSSCGTGVAPKESVAPLNFSKYLILLVEPRGTIPMLARWRQAATFNAALLKYQFDIM